MKGDKELKQHYDGRYKLVTLYDPAIRKACPKELRTNTTGQLHIGVHRIVYCWFNRIIPTGMVIDHCNSIKTDNRLENLQLFTPQENVTKERPESNREVYCKLDRPRSYYEEKLNKYEALYETAKQNHDAEEAHKQRSNVANIRSRLRYYDSHTKEVNNLTEFNKDLKELKSWKKAFKESKSKKLWHECCTIEKMVKKQGIEAWPAVKHALDVIHTHFGR